MNNFNLFGIGPMELIFILIIALVVLGPERLPQVAREMAKLMAQIREIYTEIMSTLNKEFGDMEELKEIQRDLNSLRDPLNLSQTNKPSTAKPKNPSPKPATLSDPTVAPKSARPLAPGNVSAKPAPQADTAPGLQESTELGEENRIEPPQPKDRTESADKAGELGADPPPGAAP